MTDISDPLVKIALHAELKTKKIFNLLEEMIKARLSPEEMPDQITEMMPTSF